MKLLDDLNREKNLERELVILNLQQKIAMFMMVLKELKDMTNQTVEIAKRDGWSTKTLEYYQELVTTLSDTVEYEIK